MSYPDDNPKTAVGATKVPLHLVPPVASHYLALAFKDGAAKYGPYNWREHRVSASVYYGAARRHLDAWWDGEDESPDALVHHLGHVMACCAIVLDAMTVGKLNDDRPSPGATPRLQSVYCITPAQALDLVSMDPPTVEFEADPALVVQIQQAEAADDPEPATSMGINHGTAYLSDLGANPPLNEPATDTGD